MRKLTSLLAIAAISGFAACAGENKVEVPDVDVSRDTVAVPDVDVNVGTDTATVRVPDIDVKVTNPDSTKAPPPPSN